MRDRAYTIATAALTIIALASLLALRFVGLYSHQALAVVLALGLLWAVLGRGGLAWRGRLRTELRRGFRLDRARHEFRDAVARAGFWGITAAACLWVFPRSTETLPIMAILGGIGVLRIAASFVTPRQSNSLVTVAMVIAAAVLLLDLGRTFLRGSAPAQIAPPFKGEWLVGQGGPSPLQNHHLSAYNQRFAIDLVRLENGYIFDASREAQGNAAVYSWEQPLLSPANGRVVFTRDDMEDADGVGTVDSTADAAGNVIVIELDNGLFVLLAHLRHGSLRIGNGDVVRKGDILALIGNSGNTTMPHLHLQVQTHVDLWNPDNRSVPFAFETDGRVPIRNDRVIQRRGSGP